MDSPYDMNKTLSPEQSRSQIWTMLVSVDLPNYMGNFERAGIDFHAFCNLTRADMRRVGIINYEHQTLLIEAVRPMATMYRELENYKFDWAQIAKNMSQSSELLASSLIAMNKTLKENRICYHSLVDSDTTSIQGLQVLLDMTESRINLMGQDLQEILGKAEGDPQKTDHSRYKLVFRCLLALAGGAAAAVFWQIKTPYRVPGIHFFAK